MSRSAYNYFRASFGRTKIMFVFALNLNQLALQNLQTNGFVQLPMARMNS